MSNRFLIYLSPAPLQGFKACFVQSLAQYKALSSSFDYSCYLSLSSLGSLKLKSLLISLSSFDFIPTGIQYFPFFLSNFSLSLYQFLFVLFTILRYPNRKIYIYSRNSTGSFLLSFLNIEHLLEYHSLENSYIHSFIQSYTFHSYNISSIFISKALSSFFEVNYGKLRISQKLTILHDFSPVYNNLLHSSISSDIIEYIGNSQVPIIAFSGSSGFGRGVDLILQVVDQLPQCNFIMIGNIPSNYSLRSRSNIFFTGPISNDTTLAVLNYCSIGLMPYQSKLSLGKYQLNSISWMSPLKMFDYMASNLAIISSYHSVLDEVLTDNYSCIFVDDYSSVEAWVSAILKLYNNPTEIQRLSKNAFDNYYNSFSLDIRTKSILNLFSL